MKKVSHSAVEYEAGTGVMPESAQIQAGRGVGALNRARVGTGVTRGHYGELFQGQIERSCGTLQRCLVSLTCKELFAKAAFHADGSTELTVHPHHKQKALRAAELTLEAIGYAGFGGRLTLASNIAEGKGIGSSTADCVASTLAVADAFSWPLSDLEVARLVVSAETASDNIMFRHAVLFAQREGRAVENYGVAIPAIRVLGVDTDEQGTVDTLSYPPAMYNRKEIGSFHELVSALRYAMRKQDKRLLGRIATASAMINERFLPKPFFRDIHEMAEAAGALGVAVAHSGTVMSILLDPAQPDLERTIETLQRDMSTLGLKNFCVLTTAS